MAWIELHQSVWTHRKTLLLASKLGIKPTYAAAHMARLWCWAVDNAPEGDLTGLPADVIAYGADWSGDPQQFVAAATEAGYFEQSPDGRLVIRNWHLYAGRLIERREAERERARRRRQRSLDAAATSAGRPADVRRTSAQRPRNVRQKSAGTIPNHTVPNHTVPNRTKPSSSVTLVRNRESNILPPPYYIPRAHEANFMAAAAAESSPLSSPDAEQDAQDRVAELYERLTGNEPGPRDREQMRELVGEALAAGRSLGEILAAIRDAHDAHVGEPIRCFGYFRAALKRLIVGKSARDDALGLVDDMPRILAERQARAEAEAPRARSPPDAS